MNGSLLRRPHSKLRGRVLFVGHCYYNGWYLSRALRELGWRADVLNWDATHESDLYYHGEDFRFEYRGRGDVRRHLRFYQWAIRHYDIFHFSNAHRMRFGDALGNWFTHRFSEGADVRLLKRLGKKIVYTNNGCLDGVTQSSFAAWGERPVCTDCAWREVPNVCSDELNRHWGELRNELADFQILSGGNRADFNLDPSVHEVPEFYCLDPELWRPDLEIPPEHRLGLSEGTFKIFHAVGNAESRTLPGGRNVKSTHLWIPLVERLKSEGHDVELITVQDMPNTEVRFHQAQADVLGDMLTFGWFGATAREMMMLGKPVVGHLRPEWLDQARTEVPDYIEQLPVVDANPDTVYEVVKGLIEDPERRAEIGRRSREFAVRWHSAEAGARRMDQVYRELIGTT